MQPIERCRCGKVVTRENVARSDDRACCPFCGSTIRDFELTFADVLPIQDNLGVKASSAGQRKPWYESFNGSDWYRKFQKFMQKARIIDRRSDNYFELVKDPDTGEVIHCCSEPLSQHRNHGSARKKE